jgi:hypothetical protein
MWESRRLFQVSVEIRALQRISIETAFSIGHDLARTGSSLVLFSSALSALMKAKALPLHLNDLGVSQEPIKNGGGCRYVTQELPPILSRSICGNQCGTRFVTAHKDFEEIFGGTGAELLHAEVLKDKKIDARELIDESAPFARGFSFGKILSQIENTPNDGSVAGSDGTDGNSNGDVGFPDTGRSDQQNALMGGNEASCGQFHELRAGYLRIEGEIKVRELLNLDNTCLFEATGKESVRAASEFVRNDEFEELEVIQRGTTCLFETNRQGLGNA